MPDAVANQFGRLARTADNVSPLHLLTGIGAVIVGLDAGDPLCLRDVSATMPSSR